MAAWVDAWEGAGAVPVPVMRALAACGVDAGPWRWWQGLDPAGHVLVPMQDAGEMVGAVSVAVAADGAVTGAWVVGAVPCGAYVMLSPPDHGCMILVQGMVAGFRLAADLARRGRPGPVAACIGAADLGRVMMPVDVNGLVLVPDTRIDDRAVIRRRGREWPNPNIGRRPGLAAAEDAVYRLSRGGLVVRISAPELVAGIVGAVE